MPGPCTALGRRWWPSFHERSTSADAVQAATLPGQHAGEVYGLAIVVFAFQMLWSIDVIGSWWLGVPLGFALYHVIALGCAALGSIWGRWFPGQAYHWPQSLHWWATGMMAWISVRASFPLSRWLAWPLGCFLILNLVAWLVERRAWGLLVFTCLHGIGFVVWQKAGFGMAWPIFVGTHVGMLAETLLPRFAWCHRGVRQIGSGESLEKEVWLTIDDGPCDDTEAILSMLERYGAKATFFLIGERVAVRPAWAQAIASRGHAIGNHTYRHPAKTFWSAPPWVMAREIAQTQACLEQHVPQRPQCFRGPVGFTPPWLQLVLDSFQLRLIGWDARGFDGVGNDADKALRRLQRDIRPGSIILLHQGRPMSVPLLEALLAWLDAEGFRSVIPKGFENEAGGVS